MIREDKFGRRIYSNEIWLQMVATGEKLTKLGYAESLRKPNLFYSKRDYGFFFADMRGTNFVPIWEDPVPMIYWNFESNVSHWKCRRLIEEELAKLKNNRVKCRFSDHIEDDPLFIEASGNLDPENLELYWEKGYCGYCGKDFQAEGRYCSTECENKQIEEWKNTCEACREKIDFGKEIVHHVSYSPPETVLVHQSCHAKIHRSEQFPDLKPKDKGNYPKKNSSKSMPKLGDGEGIPADQFCIVCHKAFKKNSKTVVYQGFKIHTKCVPRRELWRAP